MVRVTVAKEMALRSHQGMPCWIGLYVSRFKGAIERGEEGYHFQDTVVVV